MRVRYGKPIKVKSLLGNQTILNIGSTSTNSTDIMFNNKYYYFSWAWNTNKFNIQLQAHKYFFYVKFKNNISIRHNIIFGSENSQLGSMKYYHTLISANERYDIFDNTASSISTLNNLWFYYNNSYPNEKFNSNTDIPEYYFVVDLTESFGSGKEPTAQQFYNKYKANFFVIAAGEEILIDSKACQVPSVIAEGTTNIITKFDTSFESYADNTSLSTLHFTNQAEATVFKVITLDGRKCANFIPIGNNYRCFFTEASSISKTYTVSVEYKSDTAYSTAFHIERYGGDYSWQGSSAPYTNSDVGKWKRLSLTFTNTSDTTLYCFIQGSANANIYFRHFQIEEKDHATPYVNGTRPDNYILPCKVAGGSSDKYIINKLIN